MGEERRGGEYEEGKRELELQQEKGVRFKIFSNLILDCYTYASEIELIPFVALALAQYFPTPSTRAHVTVTANSFISASSIVLSSASPYTFPLRLPRLAYLSPVQTESSDARKTSIRLINCPSACMLRVAILCHATAFLRWLAWENIYLIQGGKILDIVFVEK